MAKRVRYVLEEGSPFAFHSEGLTIEAITRKSEVPVTIEIEGLTRKRLVELQAAIHQELVRREESWRQQRTTVSPMEADSRAGHESASERPAA